MHHIICVWQNFLPRKGSTSRSSFQGVNTGLWFLSTIWRDSRDLAIMDTLRPNIHLGSLETQINNTKIKRWFHSWNLAVWRIIKGSMYHRFGSRFVFLLSSLTNHKIKVRVLVIWRVGILGLIIWMYSTGLHIYLRFYWGHQGAHPLGCSLDHYRVPRTHRLYQGLLHMPWPLWGWVQGWHP